MPFPHPIALPTALPTDLPHVSLCVNHDWAPIVAGALKVLLDPATFDATDADFETARKDIWNLIQNWQENCVNDVQFQQTDDCLLQVSFDGGSTWTTIYDGSTCIAAKIADGTLAGGSKTPQTGGTPNVCIDTFPAIDARGAWQLPHLVSAGDTIEVTIPVSPQVWTDDIFDPVLYCADGTLWSLVGGCGAGEPAHSGDPDMSANHMELLLAINGVFYRPLSGKVTVPGGVQDAPAFLLANDVLPSDNLGQITVKVEYCAVGYLHIFDFTTSDQSFRYPPSGCGANTVYHAGEGFSDSGSGADGAYIETPALGGPTIHLLRVRFVFANTWAGTAPVVGVAAAGCTSNFCLNNDNGATFVEFNCDEVATEFVFLADQWQGGQQYFGTQRLKELWIYGAGTDPF